MNTSILDIKKITFNVSKVSEENEVQFAKELKLFFIDLLKINEEIQIRPSLIYYNLPFWWILADNKIERWINSFPQYNANELREKQYNELFDLVINRNTSIINFTITEFACSKLKKIPEYINIEFCNSDKPYINLIEENGDGLLQLNIKFGYPKFDEATDIRSLINNVIRIPDETIIPDIFIQTQDENDTKNDETLLNFFKFLIINKFIFKDIGRIVFLLSKVLVEKEGRERSFGGIILALDNTFNIAESKSILDNYWLRINIKFREWAIWQWSVKQRRELIYHSMRSAVAAIMGRNMSHNIGSHVLSNLKNETKRIADRISDKRLECEDIGLLESLKIDNDFFFGISWFINYLQERQDYIATLSGFENQTFIPVNFKNFILDGFLPDHHHLRHNGDISIKNHKNFLLEHIATSENLKRENIKTYFGKFNTSEPQSALGESFMLISQLNVSLPGGIIGRQAFFSILENLIRNAAKHSMNNNSGDLEIHIDCPHLFYDKDCKTIKLKKNDTSIYPNSEGIFKIVLGDKEEVLKIEKNKKGNYWLKNENDKEKTYNLTFDEENKLFHTEISNKITYIYDYDPHEFVLFTLTDNLRSFDTAKAKLNEALIDTLIDSQTGILNSKYKGLKEMRISALWMRGLKITDIEDEQFPPILQIRRSSDGSIEYVFFLLKPKELLFVLPEDQLSSIVDSNLSIIEKFRNSGVEFICENEINKISNFRHSLFVIEKSIFSTCDKSKFNQRVIQINFEFILQAIEDIKNTNFDEEAISDFIAKFWELRIQNRNMIYIFDDQRIDGESDLFSPISADYNNTDCKILFRKHNDTKDNFSTFKTNHETFFDNLIFLEGISGGNSTDLYMRKLSKDKLLYHKLIESCLTNVLIIDERIWNNNSCFSINKIELQVLDEEKLHSFISNRNDVQEIIDWKKYFVEEFSVKDDAFVDQLFDHRDDFDFIKDKLIKNNCFVTLDAYNFNNDYSFNLFAKKNIQLLNILFNESEKSFSFYNLNKEKYYELSFDKHSGMLTNAFSTEKSFDIICIHQGIIDKIHEKSRKEFSVIFNSFNKFFPDKIKIVHSGRSKPSSEIPEGYYFLPYSSLENAFNDCKFSLTEVLFNVKKEVI